MGERSTVFSSRLSYCDLAASSWAAVILAFDLLEVDAELVDVRFVEFDQYLSLAHAVANFYVDALYAVWCRRGYVVDVFGLDVGGVDLVLRHVDAVGDIDGDDGQLLGGDGGCLFLFSA